MKKFEETKRRAKEILEVRMRNAEVQRQKDEWRRKKREDAERLAAEHKVVKEQIKSNIAQKLNQTFQDKKSKYVIVKSQKEVQLHYRILKIARETDIDIATDRRIDGEDPEEAGDPGAGGGAGAIPSSRPG